MSVTRQTLILLGGLWLVCFVLSGVFKNGHGVGAALGTAGWLGFLVLTLLFIVVAVMTIVRNRRLQA